MSMNKGRITLAVIAVIAAGLLVVSMLGVGGDTLSVRKINQGLDLAGGVSIVFQADKANPTADEMSSVESMLRDRLDRRGYTEAPVSRVGSNRFQVDIPGVSDAEQAITDIGRTAMVTFRAPGEDGPGEVLFDGSHIVSASRQIGQNEQSVMQNSVALEFNSDAAGIFAEATAKYKNQIIYIMMDDDILSAPTVSTAITDGRCIIQGNFTADEAAELAALIRAGSLPFSLDILSVNMVGAQLGENALRTSIIAGVIGLALVLIFMIIVYKAAGAAADLALLVYVGLMLVIMSAMRITLTLPGIAGIVLSIGMAVDANVIIFERLKEELADGKRSLRSALDMSFKRAFSAIFDSNFTSLLAAVILYMLGTGPVKGFAVTLSIGIVLSMFTAIIVTRMILRSFNAIGINKQGQYAVLDQGKKPFVLRRLKDNTLHVVENGKKHYFVTGAIIVIGLLFMTVNGITGNGMFNYDVEFSGGTSMHVDFKTNVDNAEAERIVSGVTGDVTRVQSINSDTELLIKMKSIDSETRVRVIDALKEKYPLIDESGIVIVDVSATVSGEMQRTAIIAVLAALGIMFVYIAFRFRNVKIGGSTIINLLLNTFALIGFYAIFRIPLDFSFIIAILTVLGYSCNNTIVLFDRLRENMKLFPRVPSGELINRSVSQTLTRSLYTVLTTLFVTVCLIILGVQSIREFALPITLGIVFGTYTSVCFAGSVLHSMGSAKKA